MVTQKRSTKNSTLLNKKPIQLLESPDQNITIPQPSPETLKPGTLDEHLEATLSLVKDPNRYSGNLGIIGDQTETSWETWEFVYRGLEEKGYNKDIGDRGDILHQIPRQNLYSEVTQLNKNVNNNLKRDTIKSKPMGINQALQQLTLNENRERVERPSTSSKSSQSISHIIGHDGLQQINKRNSVYDNLSTGFETAPQDSDDYDERNVPLRILNKVKNDKKLDINKTTSGSSSSSRSCSSKGAIASISRPDLPSETSRSSNTNTNTNTNTTTIHQNNNGNFKEEKAWSCSTCTFLNGKTRSSCEMCGKSKTPGPEAKPLISGGRQCPQCTLINEREAQECSACGVHLEGSSTYI